MKIGYLEIIINSLLSLQDLKKINIDYEILLNFKFLRGEKLLKICESNCFFYLNFFIQKQKKEEQKFKRKQNFVSISHLNSHNY